jgi:hypothetical protein
MKMAIQILGAGVPFPTGTNVLVGTNVSFPIGILVPVKKLFNLWLKFERLTYFFTFQAFPASSSRIGQKKSYCH